MNSKWIIRRHDPVSNKWQFLYLYHTGEPVWHDNTATSTHRFNSKEDAVKCLTEGKKNLRWGGVHVIEEIFVL